MIPEGSRVILWRNSSVDLIDKLVGHSAKYYDGCYLQFEDPGIQQLQERDRKDCDGTSWMYGTKDLRLYDGEVV